MNNFQKTIKIFALCLAAFIILNIFLGVIYGLSYFIPNNNRTTSFVESYENILKVDLETAGSSIKIVKGNEFKVKAQNINHNFDVKKTNNTLEIDEDNEVWFMRGNANGLIIITIPDTLLKLDIEAGTGQVDISDIEAENFSFSIGAGSVKISNCFFNTSDIDGGVGKIKIVNSHLGKFNYDAGVGKSDIEAFILDNSTIKSGVGQIDLHLLGDPSSYELYLEKGIGVINVNGNNYSSESTYGKGDNRINISSGIGKIKVALNESAR